jgi:hypothetical protein
MSTMNNTVNLVAEGNIPPFRAVSKVPGGGKQWRVRLYDAFTYHIGVTDGSVSNFAATMHATDGEVVSLQNGQWLQLELAGSVAPGAGVGLTGDGRGQVASTTLNPTFVFFTALEGGSAGEIIWVAKVSMWNDFVNQVAPPE